MEYGSLQCSWVGGKIGVSQQCQKAGSQVMFLRSPCSYDRGNYSSGTYWRDQKNIRTTHIRNEDDSDVFRYAFQIDLGDAKRLNFS